MQLSPEVIATATRDGVVESVHRGTVVVADAGGVTARVGDVDQPVYPRSALKPFQSVAILDACSDAGVELDAEALAIASASHDGGDDPQVAAAALLAEAGLDESALRCPPAWPIDERVLAELDAPTALSHNCSGKHAAMILAHTLQGRSVGSYLYPSSPLQFAVRDVLADLTGEAPSGPAVDGCGAPAWLMGLGSLARGYRLLAAAATPQLGRIRDAMTAHPRLVGGPTLPDTMMMGADVRVVAKRGAEGIMAAGFHDPRHGPLGVAVKVADGGDRAAGPVMAAVLDALGAVTPEEVRRAPVLGGGVRHGEVAATPAVALAVTERFGLV